MLENCENIMGTLWEHYGKILTIHKKMPQFAN